MAAAHTTAPVERRGTHRCPACPGITAWDENAADRAGIVAVAERPGMPPRMGGLRTAKLDGADGADRPPRLDRR
jgi:hypothetical protein